MEIRRASPGDYGELVGLTSKEGWNYREEDFRRLDRSGNSVTLVSAEGGRVFGMITLMDYGSVGWISNVVIAEQMRDHGIGRWLLREGLRVLGRKTTVGLFSYKRAVGFYLKEGFKVDQDFYYVRFTGGHEGSAKHGDLRDLVMDRECFGYSRMGILEVLTKTGEVISPVRGRGFAIVRRDPTDPTVGPAVADDREAGLELLYAAFNRLGKGCYAVLQDPRIEGVEVMEEVTRLYVGEPPEMEEEKIFALTGLEFG